MILINKYQSRSQKIHLNRLIIYNTIKTKLMNKKKTEYYIIDDIVG